MSTDSIMDVTQIIPPFHLGTSIGFADLDLPSFCGPYTSVNNNRAQTGGIFCRHVDLHALRKVAFYRKRPPCWY